MQPDAAACSVSLRAELPTAVPVVRASPEQLQRVLFNLIQNAIRNTPADGRVTVRQRRPGPRDRTRDRPRSRRSHLARNRDRRDTRALLCTPRTRLVALGASARKPDISAPHQGPLSRTALCQGERHTHRGNLIGTPSKRPNSRSGSRRRSREWSWPRRRDPASVAVATRNPARSFRSASAAIG